MCLPSYFGLLASPGSFKTKVSWSVVERKELLLYPLIILEHAVCWAQFKLTLRDFRVNGEFIEKHTCKIEKRDNVSKK